MNPKDFNLKICLPAKSFTDILVISPGISGGQDNILIQTLREIALKENIAIVTWDFTFFILGKEIDKNNDIQELETVINHVKEQYPTTRIHLAGKSYGGLISSLVDPTLSESLCVFGLLKDFEGIQFKKPKNKPLFVIHGTEDRFFTIDIIKNYFKNEENLLVVKGGTHGLSDKDGNFIGEDAIMWYIKKLNLFINKNLNKT
ncbi:MAG: hypothetical protein ACOX6Q_02070 [Candidatus Dojkabacteria bacterium]|jgi:alpha/beta superfamily hydrolase